MLINTKTQRPFHTFLLVVLMFEHFSPAIRLGNLDSTLK